MLQKAVCLISGGIDSAVAMYLMLERGVEVVALHMDNRPFTDDEQVEKVWALVSHILRMHSIKPELLIVPHGSIFQAEIARRCARGLQCVLCKRMMYRVASAVAKECGAQAIITGESLGQVASQTLQNLAVEEEVAEIPVVRPLIGLDKMEIIDMAKEIGTYEISIGPGMGCTIVPERPRTRATLTEVLKEEEKLDMNILMNRAMRERHVRSG